MKTNNSPKKNYIYNIIYQILILIIPLITSPYLSRVVGVNGIGIYSYRYSIVYYFMLITLLGVNNYGNRTIAKVRENKENLSKKFWSIYCIQLFMGVSMLIVYNLYVSISNTEYKNIAYIDNLFIISSILDINWFFFGLEEFKKTITRNTIIKIGNIILIFAFIKSTTDLWKYTLIVSGMTCISQLLMWFYLRNKVKFVKVTLNDIVSHFKANIILFVPVIAVSLYKIMDKIMLGIISGVGEVGYYEQAEKIINIPLTIITSLGTVMLPRISNISANGSENQILVYINKSIKFVMFLSMSMCFGLVAIGESFAPLFYGSEFGKSGILIAMLALTLPFLSFANVIRTQYLIPKEKDKIYIISVTLGAVVNLISNIILISKLGSIGACIGTILAEAIVMIYQTVSVKNNIDIKKNLKISKVFLIKAIIMFIVIYPINFFQIDSTVKIGIQVSLGMLIYIALNFKYILYELNVKEIILKFTRKKVKV